VREFEEERERLNFNPKTLAYGAHRLGEKVSYL